MEDTTIEHVLKIVNDYFNERDYEGALKALQGVKSDVSDSVWHYNMGTVYGKMNNFSLARYHFLMAEHEGFTNEKLTANLRFVESQLNLEKKEQVVSVKDNLLRIGLEAQDSGFILISFVFIIFATLSIWRRANLKLTFTFVLFSCLSLGLNWWIGAMDKGIVIKSQVIRQGPSEIFNEVDELPEGVLVVSWPHDNWLKIIYPSKLRGWVKKEGIKELK